jgi:iron-siderophore transport system ATP-binding protein
MAKGTGVSETSTGHRLAAKALTVGYQRTPVIDKLDVAIPDSSFTVIVGANGCGKSTLLRSLARMLTPSGGAVYLDGSPIRSLPPKQVARQLGLLPQGPVAPDGITVLDLVSRGRHPHQGVLRRWSAEDERAVRDAMEATDTTELADAYVDELSGGQRQRVWLAMALAQQTGILLLDEPTTFLDLAHQVEVLNLCARLHAGGRTMVAVLHDLNLACRYAEHLIAMRDGRIAAMGRPSDIVTAELIEEVFGLACRVIDDPETGTPLVIPLAPRTKETRKI